MSIDEQTDNKQKRWVPEMNLDDEVYGLIYETRDAFFRARSNELNKWGITEIEAHALVKIKQIGKDATPTQIAQLMFREHNTVSALLTRMEKKGFITRKKDPERKNIWRINFTSKGEIALQQSLKRESMHNVLAAATISKEELVVLRDCLIRIRNNALKQLARKSLANIPWVIADKIELD